MKYFVEVSKIIEGAINNDNKVVNSYVNLLIDKLKKDGEIRYAKSLESKLTGKSLSTLSTKSAFSRPVPVEKDNRFSLADKIHPQIEKSVVFLDDENESIIKSFVKYISKKQELDELGIPINPSLLLYGIPGTGKSKLAENIAARLNLPLVTARADALISSYLGSTSKNIRSLLEYAQAEPCVLFLDEFDAIAKARDDKNEIGELKRVVVSLLQNIDNLGDTVLIAATNHQHLLDPAIWRRFHYKMELEVPNYEVRFNFISSLVERFNFNDEDIENLALISKNFTGAEIEMVIFDYLRFCIVNSIDVKCNELILRMLSAKYPQVDFSPDKRKESMFFLKSIDKSIFNNKMLASIFEISYSYTSKIMKGNNI